MKLITSFSLRVYFKSIITVIAVVMLFSCENSISKIKEITTQEDTLAAIATYNMIYERSDSGNEQPKHYQPISKLTTSNWAK